MYENHDASGRSCRFEIAVSNYITRDRNLRGNRRIYYYSQAGVPVAQVNASPKRRKINMMPVGDGSFYLYLHGNVRKASQTIVGDTVKAAVSFDFEYRNEPMQKMPAWFSSALKKNPAARKNWELLIPSRKEGDSSLQEPQAGRGRAFRQPRADSWQGHGTTGSDLPACYGFSGKRSPGKPRQAWIS